MFEQHDLQVNDTYVSYGDSYLTINDQLVESTRRLTKWSNEWSTNILNGQVIRLEQLTSVQDEA